MSLTDSELALVQNIKETVINLDTKLEKHYESMQNQIAAIHTPESCNGIKEIKKELKGVVKQQNLWLGGLGLLGMVFVYFKDNIVELFKR